MSVRDTSAKIAGSRWDPLQYLKFSDLRLRPALELLARVPLAAPALVCDLGCGTGQVTALIQERWPKANVHGIDHSREMLAQAAATSGTIRWLEADVRTWQPDSRADLIFSNAALHWVEGHPALLPRLIGFLAPGGCLAVQMPLSWGLPSHTLMRETLADGGPGGRPLGSEELRKNLARRGVADTDTYYDLLSGRTRHLDIWETEYLQVLEGNDPVLEWVKGTGLRPILNDLDDMHRGIFLKEYGRRLRTAYPKRGDGRTLYPFRRLFMVAVI
jgi:trans-aconitate 2-methyltransferase